MPNIAETLPVRPLTLLALCLALAGATAWWVALHGQGVSPASAMQNVVAAPAVDPGPVIAEPSVSTTDLRGAAEEFGPERDTSDKPKNDRPERRPKRDRPAQRPTPTPAPTPAPAPAPAPIPQTQPVSTSQGGEFSFEHQPKKAAPRRSSGGGPSEFGVE